jgi:hypothetical protein
MTKIENNAVTLEELLAFSLVQADPTGRVFIEKGIITQQEFLAWNCPA